MSETYTVEGEGVTVDLMVWRRFRRATPGLVERIYALAANKHLSRLGPELPVGTQVTIPLDRTPSRVDVISLWS